MTLGTVIYASRNMGMLVIQHEDGFTLLEMLGSEGEIEIGDQVGHSDWTALGGERVRCRGELYDVYFQGCWSDPNQAVRLAGP